ncbi:acetyl-CoA C-acetyltransferase [Sporobacter termitidis DSM 10068]|uniref:Acetyl-CoA acetyltransferase n=1 Tax=Sporobacter termitidis DSM 10068 TaxID=1123282 RepID=A0A1M5VF90_9FIRM|nr:acetyl-CoA C-acetyltransferase [Sporobacter termitidis]SHH73573.1 acetyl-CoA C-acetyltransferase [Sporobacter termitidis DSM 10068]
MKDIYLVSCCRTAVGSFGGSLKDTPAAKLGSIVAKAALERASLSPDKLDEVMFGCILTAGLGQNVARQVAIGAGIPNEVPAYTVGMVCGSGMKSVIEAARAIASGDAEIILAGGTENMSAAPYAVPTARFGARMGNANMVDTMVNDGLTDAFNNYHMGVTAENICDQWGITREDLDAFALASQDKAAKAIASGRFNDEIVPVPVKVKKEIVDFKVDEFPRATSMEALGKLSPAFKKDGRVTAGNSSGINDGAAAIILASGDAVKKHGLKPLMKLVSWGQGGVDPTIMGVGPVPASKQALSKASLKISDMDLIEANEAFAAQSVAVARELGFDMSKVNPNGGALALGHPVGASGARIIVTLVHEMLKRDDAKRGLATLCIGGGMGVATIWEKV